MSPESSKNNWWEQEKSSRVQNTDQTLVLHRNLAKQYLEEEGYKGYHLGDPTLCGWTAVQICILDPNNEIPEDILIFAKDSRISNDKGQSLKPLSIEKYSYKYDSFYENYSLTFKVDTKEQVDKEYEGEFNNAGKILSLQESE